MTHIPHVIALISATVLLSVFVSGSSADDDADAIYELGPDSQRHESVPQGSVTTHTWKSSVFEGTIREYFVYVPAQYDGSKPACLMVFQDGHAYVDENGQMRVPVVFDNLIHRGELPVIVGLFINPGHRDDNQPENRWRANNRSLEYDTLSDQYARFLIEELLPHVVKEHNLNLSDDPKDRAICGMSSGGICAFTAAWNHPEWFHKVLSHIGSFTNIRGGHNYEAIIRKTDRKPIRVFLQDGKNDLNNEHGNWWLANLQMDSALAFKDYDYRFEPGEGRHNGRHGGAILPDSLRWLWRDHADVRSSSGPADPGANPDPPADPSSPEQ
ncbi:MAG: alpha/beta hydrolase-fold protein [Planctomycetaceae bacterium]